MPILMISAGTTRATGLRSVSLRVLALGVGVVMMGLFAGGIVLGRWSAGSLVLVPVVPVASGAVPAGASPAVLPFTLEQLGALSGRLFRLESQAGQLSERIGLTKRASGRAEGPASAPATAAVPPASSMTEPAPAIGGSAALAASAARGGPWLPARSTPSALPVALEGLAVLEARLVHVEQQLGLVADAQTQQQLDALRMPTRMPVRGAEISSPFGNREDPFTGRSAFHSGLDFAVAWGTTIHAAAGGRVTFAGPHTDFGNVVEIAHGNGLVTRYAHASRVFVKSGDLVLPGDAIAAVGSTGRSTGAHLHFEVLRDGEAVDPRRYLAGL